MDEDVIQIFPEEREINDLEWDGLKQTLKQIFADYLFTVSGLNIVLLSDEGLKKINVDFLDHDYYTDVITFDLSEGEAEKAGEIYISVDRIADNAKAFEVPFEEEFERVLIHGTLHLVGFGDKTDSDKAMMTEQENVYLKKLKALKNA